MQLLPRLLEGHGEAASDHQFVGALGHVSEDETGLVYMRARYMDPALGRFISEDPARDGNNWFVYVNNDPVNFSDPNGESPAAVIAILILIWQAIQLAESEGRLPPKVSAFINASAAMCAMIQARKLMVLGAADPKEKFKGMGIAQDFVARGVWIHAATVAVRNLHVLFACEDIQVEGVNS